MSETKHEVLTLVPLGQAQLARVQVQNDQFSGGIKDGGDFLPTLVLRGRQFRIKANKKETSLDARTLDVILVAARAALSKTYYAGKYVPDSKKQPDCKSADGIRPDADVKNKMNATCVDCRMNAWGSKINEATGAQGKACADYKLLILAPPTLDDEKPLQLQLPAMSLRDKDDYTQSLGSYIKLLGHNGLAAQEVVTRLKFTDDDAYPRLEFTYVRNLDADEKAKVLACADRDDVKATVSVQAAEAPETHASEQPPVVPDTNNAEPLTPPPAQADAPATPPPAVEDDSPTDDVASILTRWGNTSK